MTMISTHSILNVARSALRAQQAGLHVSSQNIAQAQTPGYTRQEVRLATARPLDTPGGQVGTGVNAPTLVRIRDSLLDEAFRTEAGKAAGADVRQDVLGRIESMFQEPSENGLSAALDAFSTSWADLANMPTSDAARQVVRQRGAEVASTLRRFSGQLEEVRSQTSSWIGNTVERINGFAEQLATLNRDIVSAEVAGQPAHELQDQRDRVLDELAKLGTVRVHQGKNGGITVNLENVTLVSGNRANELSVSGQPPTLSVAGVEMSFGAERSALGERVHTLTTVLPEVRSRLDRLAEAVVLQVNTIHANGYDATGAEAPNFFDPEGITAASIALSDEVRTDAGRIAASAVPDGAGNNRIALAMAALRHPPEENTHAEGLAGWDQVRGLLDGQAAGEFYAELVTETGLRGEAAKRAAGVHSAISAQAEARRQSVSGVSTDEELIRLVQFQHAYTAATKLVTTVDEMMQTVLNMV